MIARVLPHITNATGILEEHLVKLRNKFIEVKHNGSFYNGGKEIVGQDWEFTDDELEIFTSNTKEDMGLS